MSNTREKLVFIQHIEQQRVRVLCVMQSSKRPTWQKGAAYLVRASQGLQKLKSCCFSEVCVPYWALPKLLCNNSRPVLKVAADGAH